MSTYTTENGVPKVVISGIGGCFPQSENIEMLKKNLMDQIDMIQDARWDADYSEGPTMSGNIPSFRYFDANFFSIHTRLADQMDPMARIALEKSFEAIIDAGVNPLELRGKNIGVYMGSTIGENDVCILANVDNGFGIMGQSRGLVANRISYVLNFTGPSASMDNTWTGGLDAITQGCDAIIAGQIDAALVGSVNLITNGQISELFSKLNILNMDGKTKAFDNEADGYARSDSICVLYLQRADLAKRHYASIVNCNVEFNGDISDGYCTVNPDHMSKLLTNFYKDAKVNPKDVQYVETHGCGIKTLDEKELAAIDTVFNKDRDEPLLIGSVKSNLGHTEAASSMLSIVKVIIAMETGVIPGNLHYETPNQNIPALVNGKLEVVSKNRVWSPSLAAVNVLGLANSFGHILLQPNHRDKKVFEPLAIPMLDLLSTRTEEGIQEIIEDVKANPVIDPEYSRLVHDVFARTTPAHLYRGYVIRGEETMTNNMYFAGIKPQIWFVYSGMGSQWLGMGKSLLKLPIFAQSIELSHKILEAKGIDLIRIITDVDPNIFDNILNSFVGIAAIQIALTDVLHAIGIVPDGLIGHSVGELGCAYADGCLTAEQMILSAYYRGRASLEAELIPGMMAAIGIGAKTMKTQCPPGIDIACHNGPDSCTLSGPREDMEQFVADLQAKQIFAKLVNVSNIAYHSRYIKPAAPQLLQYLKDLIPEGTPRSPKWISTSVEESAWDTDLAKTVSAEYLTNNLLSSVYFEEGSRHIPKNSVVIEIAPHGLLQAILKNSLSSGCVNVPLTKRAVDNGLLFLSAALGELYIHGVDMNVSPLYPNVEYPVSRGTKSLTTIMRWFHGITWRSELREYLPCNSGQNIVVSLNCEEFRHVVGHRIGHDIVIPVTAYLPLICNVLKGTKNVDVLFEDIIVKRHIVISETVIGRPINIVLQRGTGIFEICDENGLIVNGRIFLPESYENEEIASAPIDTENLLYNFTESDLQNELSYRACQFSGVFNTVKQLKMYNKGSTANIEWKHDWPGFVNAMFQVGMLCEDYGTGPILPTFIRRLLINFNQLPEVQKDIQISFDYNTKIFTSSIAQIKDLKFSPYVQDDRPFTIETYNFIKYSEATQDLQCELNKCLQIVQQSLESQNPIYSITEFKNSGINSLENYIYNFSDHHFSSKIQLHILSGTSNNIPISALTIIGEQQLQHLDLLFKQTTEFILLCLHIDQQLPLNATIARIHSFHSGELQYHLLKQTCDKIPVIINIKSKCFNGSDFRNVSLPWVKHLHESLNACDKNQKNIYLVSTILPENGIEIFLKDAKSLTHGSNIRLMFLLDEHLPELDTGSTEFYQEMFRKDLPVTVFKNGHWGSYFKVPYTKSTIGKEIEDNQSISVQDLRKLFHDYTVEYVGLNPAHICADEYPDSTELGPVNFAGCNKSGERVMGIARANLVDRQMSPDPDFIWPIPHQWQTINGASIPYAYACAYYVLFELVNMQMGDSILVHNGCSSIGQAIMQLAINYNCKIITSVGSDLEKKTLLSILNRLRPHQVLLYTDSSFQNKILQKTDGEGVNVIINCHTGKAMQSSLRYLGVAGCKVVQMDLSDFDATNTSLGLQTFFSISGMFGFTPANISDLPRDLKLKIHAMVTDGMRKGYVQPLQVTEVTQMDLDPVLRYIKSNRMTNTVVLPINDLAIEIKTQKYQSINFINRVCKKNVSYIVFGSDRDMLIDTIRWLAMNGAELIGVFANVNMNFDFIKRRLASLRIQYNTDIKLIESGINIPATLRDIHEMKKISATLMLSNESIPETLKYLKQVDVQLMKLSSTAHLICFWGNHTSMTYRRSNSSLPVSNVKWDKTKEYSSVVPILEHILKEPADIVIRNEDFSYENNFSSKDFFALLAMSQDSIVSTVDSISTTSELIQLPTKGTRNTKEAYPAFVIPGLLGQKCKFLKTFLRKLLCPIYIINNGTSDSLESVAAAAVEKIKEKTSGSFNIIGISFGGALALEIAKILEEQGERTQLYLIDGIPETIQNIMNDNGNIKWLETSLLSSLLRIDASESINSLRNAPNWDARVTNALKLGKYTKRDLQKVIKGLNIIKNKINQVMHYKPHDNKTISGTTRLLRPQDSSMDFSYTLGNCCKQVQGEIIKGNHFTFLETDKLAEYINDTVIIPPLYT